MPEMNEKDYVLTPFEPHGIVQITRIKSETNYAEVRFLHKHNGYEAGSLGSYHYSELLPIPSRYLEAITLHDQGYFVAIRALKNIAMQINKEGGV